MPGSLLLTPGPFVVPSLVTFPLGPDVLRRIHRFDGQLIFEWLSPPPLRGLDARYWCVSATPRLRDVFSSFFVAAINLALFSPQPLLVPPLFLPAPPVIPLFPPLPFASAPLFPLFSLPPVMAGRRKHQKRCPGRPGSPQPPLSFRTPCWGSLFFGAERPPPSRIS